MIPEAYGAGTLIYSLLLGSMTNTVLEKKVESTRGRHLKMLDSFLCLYVHPQLHTHAEAHRIISPDPER